MNEMKSGLSTELTAVSTVYLYGELCYYCGIRILMLKDTCDSAKVLECVLFLSQNLLQLTDNLTNHVDSFMQLFSETVDNVTVQMTNQRDHLTVSCPDKLDVS